MYEDEDRYTRITLRIPRELHERLTKSARHKSRSMNAEIIDRLEGNFQRKEDELAIANARVTEALFRLAEVPDEVIAERVTSKLNDALSPHDDPIQGHGLVSVVKQVRQAYGLVERIKKDREA